MRASRSTSKRELLLLGCGGLARETAEAVRAINAERPRWSLLGFLDDDPRLRGGESCGLPILGPIERVHEFPGAAVAIATGRPDDYVSRRAIATRLGLDERRYATLVHPTATLGESCTVGAGSILLAHVDLTAGVVAGKHVVAMPQVVLPHDVRVGDFATLASGVRIGGRCRLGEGAYVGAGACVREELEIGPWSLIGMGSVVTRDVPPERLWLGTPARDAGPAPLPAGAPRP